MKVESIVECSKGSILQYFWPALGDNRYWKPIFGVFYMINSIMLFAPWEIFHVFFFLLSADFFQNQLLKEKYFRNTIRVSNRLDSDQAWLFVWPDMGQNCLQKLSTDDTRR